LTVYSKELLFIKGELVMFIAFLILLYILVESFFSYSLNYSRNFKIFLLDELLDNLDSRLSTIKILRSLWGSWILISQEFFKFFEELLLRLEFLMFRFDEVLLSFLLLRFKLDFAEQLEEHISENDLLKLI